MELTEAIKQVYSETVKTLKGSARRVFMARVVRSLGRGGQRRAARELGWDRETMRKGLHELESGYVCIDGYAARGRKSGYRICWKISKPSWMGKARPTPGLRVADCIPG